jgi:hypothetical protein
MEVYKSETREVIRRFLDHRLTLPECMTALEDALADLIPRLHGETSATLPALIARNNAIALKEMERRRSED